MLVGKFISLVEMMRRLNKGLVEDEIGILTSILTRTFDMSYLNYTAAWENSAHGVAYPEYHCTRDASPFPAVPSCAIQANCGEKKHCRLGSRGLFRI